MDGATWILTSHTLIGLIKPNTKWVHLRRTQLRRIIEAAEAGRVDTTNPEHGSREPAHKCSSESGKEWSFFALRFSTSKTKLANTLRNAPKPTFTRNLTIHSPAIILLSPILSTANTYSGEDPTTAVPIKQPQSFCSKIFIGCTTRSKTASRKEKDPNP